MQKMRMREFWRVRWLMVPMWLLWGAGAFASTRPPLYLGNVEPVRDQYGRPMRGSPSVTESGSRYRVELRIAQDGIRRPPYPDGSAHYKNPLLPTNGVVGMGVNSARPHTGLFCVDFPERLPAGTQVFARVFNAPTVAEATFYADTDPVPVPLNETTLVLVFKAAQPLDPGDHDNDGLNNSWEKVLGTYDRATPDYDGDGMRDLHEMLAGTDPTNPNSKLAFVSIRRESGVVPLSGGGSLLRPVRVRWQSVPGKKYQLEFLPRLDGEQIPVPVGEVVTAGENERELEIIVDVTDADKGSFRVRLVRE